MDIDELRSDVTQISLDDTRISLNGHTYTNLQWFAYSYHSWMQFMQDDWHPKRIKIYCKDENGHCAMFYGSLADRDRVYINTHPFTGEDVDNYVNNILPIDQLLPWKERIN